MPSLGDEVASLLEHGDALGVGPVQVLEDHDRLLLAHGLGEQLQGESGSVGQRTVVRRGTPVVGRAECCGPVVAALGHAQRVEEQAEGVAEAARLGLSGHDHDRGIEPFPELLDQAGLADAGLAAHEDHPALGLGEGDREPVELVGSTDHHRAEAPVSDPHGLSVPTITRPIVGTLVDH